MNLRLLPFFLLLTFVACIESEPDITDIDCITHEELFPPNGYNLTELGKIDYYGTIEKFQFMSDSIGYAMLKPIYNASITNHNLVFKTIDAGQTWTLLDAGINEFIQDMCFVTDNIGYLSCQGNSSKCAWYATYDGGNTWQREEIENLDGEFLTLSSNKEGILVGYLRGNLISDKNTICISEDNGETWDAIFESDDIDLTWGFLKVKEDLIYISSPNGELIKINFEGEIVANIQTPRNWIQNACFTENDEIIVSYFNSIVKSANGGGTWYTILSRSNVIVDLECENSGIILAGSEHCDRNVFDQNGLFITTSSNGEEWDEHPNLTIDLKTHFLGTYKTDSDSYYFFFDKTMYELAKI